MLQHSVLQHSVLERLVLERLALEWLVMAAEPHAEKRNQYSNAQHCRTYLYMILHLS